jgi:CDP-diacylglycerol--glycerol-3-phosphate 3-phosphatidyltransferase
VAILIVGLSGSLLVSYTRARGEGLGIQCKKGVLQRAERMLLLGFGSILDPTISAALGRPVGAALLPVLGLIAVGSTGTAVYRTIWIARALRAADRTSSDS